MDAANGQSVGGVGDFAKAAVFGDVVRDEYTADGGTESGSIFGKFGQCANGAIALGLAKVIKCPKLMTKYLPGPWGKAAKVASVGFLGTQVTGAISEMTVGDGQGVGDVLDASGNALNAAIMLSSLHTLVGGKPGMTHLARRGIRAARTFIQSA